MAHSNKIKRISNYLNLFTFHKSSYKKIIIILLFLSICINGYCQDTIYSTIYPKGVVTNSIRKRGSTLIFRPINNPDLLIIIRGKNISKIKYLTGEIYNNPLSPQIKKNAIILPTEANTGKICFSDIIEVKGSNEMDLYNSIRTLAKINPGENIYSKGPILTYTIVESDTSDNKFQQYIGSFKTESPYTVYFQLEIKFKKEKIKYTYSNFIAIYDKVVSGKSFGAKMLTSSMNWDFGGNTEIERRVLKIDNLYADQDKTDIKRFWIPIADNISQSIKELNQLITNKPKQNKIKKDDW
jgi:hypothetical protein